MMTNFNVSIQSTSNAKIVKFEINSFLTQYTSYEFGTIDEAQNSPLAQQLLGRMFRMTLPIRLKIISMTVEW
jgi:hypothetical protein